MSIPIPDPLLPTDHLRVTPWPDAVIDALGHDPRSPYVEQFWLSVLGPSTTWLLRRLATGLGSPTGWLRPARCPRLPSRSGSATGTAGTRRSCGRSPGAASSAWPSCAAATAWRCGASCRRSTATRCSRLPATLQDAHRRWMEAELRTPDATQRLRRSRRLALSLIEIGEDPEAAERQLHRWKFHPAMANDAVRWALDRHRQAAAAVAPDAGPPHETISGAATADDIGGDAALTGSSLPARSGRSGSPAQAEPGFLQSANSWVSSRTP